MEAVAFIAFWIGIYIGCVMGKCHSKTVEEDLRQYKEENKEYKKYMELMEAEKKIKELSQELKKHNYKYYFLSSPVITDKEYDDLLKELISLEEQYPELINKDSPSQTVGYKDGF